MERKREGEREGEANQAVCSGSWQAGMPTVK